MTGSVSKLGSKLVWPGEIVDENLIEIKYRYDIKNSTCVGYGLIHLRRLYGSGFGKVIMIRIHNTAQNIYYDKSFLIVWIKIQEKPWYAYKMVTQNMLRTHEGKWRSFRRIKIRFVTALVLLANALNRSNNGDYYLRAHLLLSNHLISKYHGKSYFIL